MCPQGHRTVQDRARTQVESQAQGVSVVSIFHLTSSSGACVSLTNTGTGKVEKVDPLGSSMSSHCLKVMVLNARYRVTQLLTRKNLTLQGLGCKETYPLKMNFISSWISVMWE